MLTCRYPKESGARPTLAVHPHVRGESETKRGGDTIYQGSPPRTWGKFFYCLQLFVFWVHPHARWESVVDPADSSNQIGSPPRTWGKHSDVPLDVVQRRFTPTHVGKALTAKK